MADGQYSGRRIKRKNSRGEYIIGEKLGVGGEGEIYAVANDAQKAVKIYLPGKDGNAVKLPTMEGMTPRFTKERIGHPPLAWPEQSIREQPSNTVVGFVMPRVNTDRTMIVGEFFTPDDRQEKLRKMDVSLSGIQIQETKWKIIRNLSKIMAQVHGQGHLIGDINERNILVEPQNGDVSIVDCDSFQIRDSENKVIYRCRVGHPDYTAPELLLQMKGICNQRKCPGVPPGEHKKGYPCITRSQEHDRFGIAVIAFQLLMDGNHPYDCRIDEGRNRGDGPRVEKIKQRYYPYSRSKPSYIHVNNRENEIRYSKLPHHIKDLFERAFT